MSKTLRIGFSQRDITPPAGVVLGGYAGYRPCSGAHDPLWCKAVVLEQEDGRYCLVALDLLCVDEGLYRRIAQKIDGLGIGPERLIVSAIHSHAAPQGVIAGEGPLAAVNCSAQEQTPRFQAYMDTVVTQAEAACRDAIGKLEPFLARSARGNTPPVGSERHTGAVPGGDLTVIQCKTQSGTVLTLYNFPCHPTVLGRIICWLRQISQPGSRRCWVGKWRYFSMVRRGISAPASPAGNLPLPNVIAWVRSRQSISWR